MAGNVEPRRMHRAQTKFEPHVHRSWHVCSLQQSKTISQITNTKDPSCHDRLRSLPGFACPLVTIHRMFCSIMAQQPPKGASIYGIAWQRCSVLQRRKRFRRHAGLGMPYSRQLRRKTRTSSYRVVRSTACRMDLLSQALGGEMRARTSPNGR